MLFFVARVRYRNGDWSPVLTVFESDFASAVARLGNEASVDMAVEIQIQNRPLDEVRFFDREDLSTAVVAHPHIEAWPEPWQS